MATDTAKCSMCNDVTSFSEPTTDRLADIEYRNYCWHCNECTSIFSFSGKNDAKFIGENVANSYDLGTTHEKLREFSNRSFQYLDDGQHDVENNLNPDSTPLC